MWQLYSVFKKDSPLPPENTIPESKAGTIKRTMVHFQGVEKQQ